MNSTLSSILLLILIGTTISCAQADVMKRAMKMPKPELELVDPAASSYAKVYEEIISVFRDQNQCRECDYMSGVFMTSYEMHYGYSLNKEDESQESIIPIFTDASVEEKFDQFFSQENLAKNAGKKIYCECVGDSLERYGTVFYRIRKARLFAK